MSDQTTLFVDEDGVQWLPDQSVLDPEGNPLVVPVLDNEE